MIVKVFILIGGISGALSVGLGAFGAHALKKRLNPQKLETYETGVRYQFYHVPAILAAAYAANSWTTSPLPNLAGWLFILGTLIFSGSLYLLIWTNRRWLGAITPIGGLMLIGGWICLALAPFS